MASRRQKVELVAARDLSPSVRSLSLRPEEGPLAFAAGQWVNLFAANAELRRAYSIASAPGDPELELAVTRVEGGALSPLLHALALGETLEIDGPHGFFTREPAHRSEPALFVATGTGLAPFRSMLRDGLGRGDGGAITLLFGCRTEADVLWADELRALAAAHPRFSLELTLSRPSAGHTGRSGYVQQHLVEIARRMGSPRVYACGLTRMVSECRRVLKDELGYDRKRIHTERYD